MRIEYYETKGKWYWRLIASNGQNIANGGQGYASKQGVKTAVSKLIPAWNVVSETVVEK